MSDMVKVFIGYDERQPVAFHTLVQSIIANSSLPVQVTPLVLHTLPAQRSGLTPFTFSRFLVPFLCEFQGWGIFLDIDIMMGRYRGVMEPARRQIRRDGLQGGDAFRVGVGDDVQQRKMHAVDAGFC